MTKMRARNPDVFYDGNNYLMDSDGNAISTGLPIYTHGEQPNPWDVPFGTEILIHPSCLTGYGANTSGIKLRSDGVTWRFADTQTAYGVSGTVAAPLVTGVVGSAGEFSLLGSLAQPMLPAYLLYKGARGVFRCKLRKSGANGAADVIVRLGVAASGSSIVSNDALINLAGGITNVDKREFWVAVEFIITAAGETGVASMIVTNYLTSNGAGTNVVTDRIATINTVTPMYFNINSKNANAADTFSLIEYSLELKPQ